MLPSPSAACLSPALPNLCSTLHRACTVLSAEKASKGGPLFQFPPTVHPDWQLSTPCIFTYRVSRLPSSFPAALTSRRQLAHCKIQRMAQIPATLDLVEQPVLPQITPTRMSSPPAGTTTPRETFHSSPPQPTKDHSPVSQVAQPTIAGAIVPLMLPNPPFLNLPSKLSSSPSSRYDSPSPATWGSCFSTASISAMHPQGDMCCPSLLGALEFSCCQGL